MRTEREKQVDDTLLRVGSINSGGRVNYNQRFARRSSLLATGRLIYEDKMAELIYKMVDRYHEPRRPFVFILLNP